MELKFIVTTSSPGWGHCLGLTRQWHWDFSLLDFGIFEIGLRIRMGCGCERQICLIGNLFSMCANYYVPCVFNFKMF